MRLFLYLLLLLLLTNCTTVEVTKEIIKAGNTVKTSITEIVSNEERSDQDLIIDDKGSDQIKNIEIEKEIITTQQSEEKVIVETQQNIVETNFFGNSLNQIKEILGKPILSRKDGNIYVLRYDSKGCRLFLFFKNSEENKKVKYFELRDIVGNLIESKQSIEQCYREFHLIN